MTVEAKTRVTDPENRCLQAFAAAHARLGNAPLLEDVAAEMGVTRQYVSRLIKGLIQKGKIVRNGRYRSCKVA